MASHKYIDRICLAAALLSLLAAMLLFSSGAAQSSGTAMGYEARLFDTGRVHAIDIVMDDWDAFLETCENEEYANCAVVIDGEAYKNIGIRAKGNTSLSMVSSMDSSRYSFKLEFDQYDTGRTYHGLDKLCLNNLIQDNTCMKDYLVYQMMADYGVDAPLCSYVYISVNGEDWGLYLAVEGVEESFLQRTGNSQGDLYKPDSLSMGGGRGNGRNFDMDAFDFGENTSSAFENFRNQKNGDFALTDPAADRPDWTNRPGGRPWDGMDSPERANTPEERPENREDNPEQANAPEERPENREDTPEQADGPEERPESGSDRTGQSGREFPPMPDFGGGRGGPGGMGASDVKLQYIDDDPDSYSNIFDSAKTDVSDADKTRLIAALKALGEGDVSALDMERVLRYFAVHNYVCNGDSYTGGMIHNYYLYEEAGRLSMIPWDYNLAFGSFQSRDASSAVNDPIDTPQSVTGSGDRPMIDWIFSDAAYTEEYHQYFAGFLESVDPVALIAETSELIAPYLEKDPTKFCTCEEFQTAVQALTEFCRLRTESVAGQLAGEIPAASAGQSADPSALVDASGLNLSDMGNMNRGGFGGNRGQRNGNAMEMPGAFTGMPGQPDAAPPDGAAPGQPDAVPPAGDTTSQPDATPSDTAPTEAGQDRAAPDGAASSIAFRGGPGAGGPPDFRGGFDEESLVGRETFVLLGGSVLVLLAGILILKRYRRRGV